MLVVRQHGIGGLSYRFSASVENFQIYVFDRYRDACSGCIEHSLDG